MTARKILHIDLDAFFCSVEELEDPSLVGKPFAVGGKPGERGVVASCSYAARQRGVHSAMPTGQALRLCPDLIVLHGRHRLYGEKSDRVMEIISRLTPLVEQVSIDEAFADVSDLPQSGLSIAQKLQQDIQSETHLPCSIGVASNKLIAKVATDYGKGQHKGISPPRAITVVEPGKEAEFLAPLPVRALWGVGPKTEAELAKIGMHLIGDLSRENEKVFIKRFGKYGYDLIRRSKGIDDSPIITEHEAKSVSQEVTFDKDINNKKVLMDTLRSLTFQVGRRLRKSEVVGSTVRLKIRWPDFTTMTRQVTLSQPVDQDQLILQEAIAMFDNVWQEGKQVRLIGVGVSNLIPAFHQLPLWETKSDKERRLLEAVDEIQERFGRNAVQRGIKKEG
jgi:DNA polymerase-4